MSFCLFLGSSQTGTAATRVGHPTAREPANTSRKSIAGVTAAFTLLLVTFCRNSCWPHRLHSRTSRVRTLSIAAGRYAATASVVGAVCRTKCLCQSSRCSGCACYLCMLYTILSWSASARAHSPDAIPISSSVPFPSRDGLIVLHY